MRPDSTSPALSVSPVTDRAAWDAEVLALGGHPLQLWGWGEVKAKGAWTPRRLRVTDADGRLLGVAQVLVRSLPAQFKSLSYVPRGPVVAASAGSVPGVGDAATRDAVTGAIVAWCRKNVGGVGITLEPDWPVGTSLDLPGSRPAPNPVLYPQTVILDLTRTPDELLASMRKSTRYEIRKGARAGLDIRRVTDEVDVRAVLAVYRGTAERAGFAIHDDQYYLDIHHELGEHSLLVAAFSDDKPVSFVWAAASASTSWELYGGADETGRRLTANAPVKWRTIEIAREMGVVRHDLNGLLNDGISDFKRSFADHDDELVGSIDVPFSMWYSAWNKGLPTAKKVVRRLRGGR